MTPEDFDALFDAFRSTAFRLETLQTYSIPREDQAYLAFKVGLPRPERSVRTSPWLRRIATSTAAGKTWSRVHLVSRPLSEYVRFELLAYVESQAAGEEIMLADLDEHPELADLGLDFWLFDADTDRPYAVLVHYGPAGDLQGFEPVTDPVSVEKLKRQQRLAVTTAVPLNTFLAGCKAA